MKLIYFAKVLDGISILSYVGMILFGCLIVVCFIGFLSEYEEYREQRAIQWGKKCLWGALACAVVAIFCPSQRDFYEIYGIGKTIDYIESNEQAKQLPDKVINILDAWLDDLNKGKEKKSE